MWERLLQSSDQHVIAVDWEVVLDVMVEVRADDGRSLADSTYASKLQSVCNRILKRGFSPTALALQVLIDLRSNGIAAVNKRVVAIADFLDAHPEVEAHRDWMSGDGMQPLAELFASEPFLLPLPRSCRFLRNNKGLLIGEGSVSEDSFDEYRRTGKGYTFAVKDVDVDELRFAHLAVAQVSAALIRLENAHQFHVAAYRAITAEIQRALTEKIPDLAAAEFSPIEESSVQSAPSGSPTQPVDIDDPVARLLARCSDAWERPYLEAARLAFAEECRSIRAALAAVALLPPSLETIGPLLTEEMFDLQSPPNVQRLPPGLDTLDAVQAEMEKRASHRITRAFLRRAKELSAQDDAARIKALTEDRERWHRVIEGRLTSTSVLHARIGDLLDAWRASDPASPCVPLLAAARAHLERTSPVAAGERCEVVRMPDPAVPRQEAETRLPIGSQSASTLCRALEKIIFIAPRVTGNPLAIEALQRAFEIGSTSLQHPKGTT